MSDPHDLRRFVEACAAMLSLDGPSADAVLGSVDAQKLRSAMTLFARADPDDPTFGLVLTQYFESRPDHATNRLLRGA